MSEHLAIRKLLEQTVERGEAAKRALARLDELERHESARRRQPRRGQA